MDALQVATEAYTVGFLADSALVTQFAGRVTTMKKDMILAKHLRKEEHNMPENNVDYVSDTSNFKKIRDSNVPKEPFTGEDQEFVKRTKTSKSPKKSKK